MGKTMSRLFEMEPEPPKQRQKPRKLMHVIDAGGGGCGVDTGEHRVRFGCEICKHETEWQTVKTVTEGKRGIPCPKCNPE